MFFRRKPRQPPAPSPGPRKSHFEQLLDQERELLTAGDTASLRRLHGYLFSFFTREVCSIHLPSMFTEDCPCGFNHFAGRPSLNQSRQDQGCADNADQNAA